MSIVRINNLGITDGTIVNADINSSAAIALTKLASTGTLTVDNIQFPATQVASANANNLDDYEEGTFTPTVVGTSTAGTGTYSTQVGTYTKIGNRVYFSVYIVWSAHTGTGDMNMGGLPFTSNSNNFSPCAVVNSNIGLSGGYILSAWVVDSSTRVGLVQYPSGGGGNVGVALDTSATFAASGHYFI